MKDFASEVKTIFHDGKFLFLPMSCFIVLTGIMLYISASSYVKFASTEIIASWIASESTNIQQGNLLESLARNRRILVSSSIIRGVSLIKDREVKRPRVQTLFGNIPYLFPTREGVSQPDRISYESRWFLQGRIQYRFKEAPSYYIEVNVYPDFIIRSFFLIFALYSVSFSGLFLIVSRASVKERENRLEIIKTAVDDLINRGLPSDQITRSLPNLGAMWPQMKLNLEKLEKEVASKARMITIAEASAQLTHDMRAPIGTFERLLMTKDEDVPKMRPAIRESVNRLYTMVDSLRHGELENIVRKKEYTLDFDFGYESLIAKAKEQKVIFEVPRERIENALIDLPKVERAWINLASNALDFAKTFVRVESEIRNSDIFIRVIDDGLGVPDEFLPRLFQRGATHGKHDGTGLGLAYVKQVMMGHGGDVRYYRENRQTIFECFIPGAVGIRSPSLPVLDLVDSESKESLRRNIGIALRNPKLCSEILDKMIIVNAKNVFWHIGFDKGHNFVITDDPCIVEKCIDEGIIVAEFKPDTPASEIVRKALIRLGIREGEGTEDALR